MTFQTLDDKRDCKGVFYNGEFYFDKLPRNLDLTWSSQSYGLMERALISVLLIIFLIVMYLDSDGFKHMLRRLFNRKSTWKIIAFMTWCLGIFLGTFIKWRTRLPIGSWKTILSPKTTLSSQKRRQPSTKSQTKSCK